MTSRKLLGISFLIAASAGFLFCIIGIIQIWRFREAAARAVEESGEVLKETLDNTQDGLAVLEEMLETTAQDVHLFETTLQTVTLTIEDTNSVLDSLSNLTESDLPGTIAATQTSLASAQTSALLIDDIITALTRIPFLGLGTYQPEVPLSDAIGDISESLDPLTPALESMSEALQESRENLNQLERDLDIFSETAGEIRASFENAQAVVDAYQAILVGLEGRLETLRRSAPANITAITWFLTLPLVALAISQVAVGERGIVIWLEENKRNEE